MTCERRKWLTNEKRVTSEEESTVAFSAVSELSAGVDDGVLWIKSTVNKDKRNSSTP